MAPQAGEATILTVYADILYTFSPPEHKPPHQRFDMASLVYLYQKSPEGHGRLELANNAGTAEQDAVAGSLGNASITYSYKKPTIFTIEPSQAQPWKLPTFDPRQERKYMYPVRSIDIYFWEPQEALLCLESLRQIHGIGHFGIEDVPHAQEQHEDAMSPVIDRLEKAAIQVQDQRRKDSSSTGPSAHTDSTSMNSYRSTPITASGDSSAAFAPMPYNPAAPAAPEARAHREKTPPPPETESIPGAAGSAAYAPMQNLYGHPYQANHFAPPGPASGSSFPPPPPPQQQASPPPQPAQHGSSFLPPPPPTQPSVSPPPASAYHSAVQTPLPFSPPPTQPSFSQQSIFQQQHASGPTNVGGYGQQPQQQYFPARAPQSGGFSLPPQSPGFAPAPQSPGFAPPPQSPGFASQPPQSPGFASHAPQSPGFAPPIPQGKPIQPGYPYQQQQQQQQQQQPPHAQSYFSAPTSQQSNSAPSQQTQQAAQQPPQGGYSDYSYAHQPTQQQQHYDPNSIHSQVYRPTEAEAAHTKPQSQQGTGTWGSRADKAEKSVNRFLKKLDKKW